MKKIIAVDENEKYHEGRDHCHYTVLLHIISVTFFFLFVTELNFFFFNLRYKTTKEIPVVFHNHSRYYYRFIIKKLAEEFKEQLECFGENTEKYIVFSVPLEKELDNSKVVTCKIKSIDSLRFMLSSLSNLADILLKDLRIANVKAVDLVLNT